MIHGVTHSLFSSAAVLAHIETDQRLPAILIHDCEDVPELPFGVRFTQRKTADALSQKPVDETADRHGGGRCNRYIETG
ncbi:hypothetical protein GOL78_15130 [Sinorhizobium medicae]|nr:hypothetical protein [Sinorhizobium medicae]MDX1006730.1 hypothetical protein [Sinorhizobium medicae]MDX1210838.1 hypothetical protein [Sinorhizobium medicae]